MKRTIYYMIIGYLLLGTGCSDWLSVNPKDKVEQKEMFSDENGFKNALIGNYIMLKDSKLYGKTLTMEFCENLAQHWKTNPQAIDGYTAAYDYKNTEVEELIEEIYGKFYNTIVNINNLLDYVDNGVLTSDMHDLIKGEALAMRAFCHLDILRLFGPIPGEQTKDRILSYVRTVSKNYHEVNTWEEYVGYLEKDLNDAEVLLKEVEEKGMNDEFFSYRQNRLNYWAVLALKARFYLWIQDTERRQEISRKAKHETLGIRFFSPLRNRTTYIYNLFYITLFDQKFGTNIFKRIAHQDLCKIIHLHGCCPLHIILKRTFIDCSIRLFHRPAFSN